MSMRPDGRGDQLLRRSASFVRGQRGEGHGQRQAGLSGGVAAARAAPPAAPAPAELLVTRLNDELRAVVQDVIRLTPNIVEVVVRSAHGRARLPAGQFYRLQNYETLATRVNGTTLGMEGLALTGASVDREKGLLSTIVLEMGGSSDLCALLSPASR